MKTILVGFTSGQYFAKGIIAKTKKECEEKARQYLKDNTLTGTSSKGVLWSNSNIIAHIKVVTRKMSKRVENKRRILY